jgi:hypothetical protein
MSRPSVLDPFPGFESSLLPPLDNLNSLRSYQLALVPFHPEATLEQHAQARTIFRRRRMEALSRREELGMGEKTLEQRQMRRAQEWLEGKVPGSRRMVDGETQTDGKLFTAEEVKKRVVNVSKAAVERALEEERKKLKEELKLAVEEERRKGEEAIRAVVEASAKMVLEAKEGRKKVRRCCSPLLPSLTYLYDLSYRLLKPLRLL